MPQMLIDHVQRHVVRTFGWLAAILLSGMALAVQPNAAPEISGDDRQQSQRRLADSTEFRITVAGTRTSSDLVTLEELLHIVPEKAMGEVQKAERARAENRTEEAIAHFNRALLIDPDFAAARNNLATILLPTNPELAVSQLEEAIKIDPRNPLLFLNLTLGYAMLHRLDIAERAARRAVGLDRTGGYARFLLGVVLVDQKQFTDEALKCLEQAPHFPVAHLLAARVLLMQNNLDRAKSEIQMYMSTGDQDNRAIATSWLDLIDQEGPKSALLLPQ